ncbi:MAG TPA: PRC-barrel domain-containing protein [Methylomirabilota bacterium]|jgi:hypothetical protein|nr:PRC-barrel domain-containing protein [Methylomirabilota bacterium]
MLHSARELVGYTIGATDGDIGAVHDFYFDDESWTIRYLVADTGDWLPGRKVLISPMALREPRWTTQRLPVGLTRAQVERSPGVDTARPVTRHYEAELAGHYGYPYYWAGPYRWGAGPYPFAPIAPEPVPVEPEALTTLEREGMANVEHRDSDRHLRSVQEVRGYYIQAADGDIGHVDDFLIDDRTWAIRYMVIDTRNWWPGKQVLVSPEWIAAVSWNDSKVHIDLTREVVKSAPEYDPAHPLERELESRLHEHYGRRKYWETEDRDRAA